MANIEKNTTNQVIARDLINVDTYLASLASDAHAIDPLLNPLRGVTANIESPDTELSPAQIATLQTVRRSLENHLVNNERVRVFTPQSLQKQIDYHFGHANRRRAALNLTGSILLVALATGLVALFASSTKPELRIEMILSTCLAMFHVSAALLFLMSLSAFTDRLHVAFRWICTGIVLLGLSLMLQPLWNIFGSLNVSLTAYLELMPVIITAIAFYVGVLLFVNPFFAITRLLRARSVGSFAVVIGLASVLLPHAGSSIPEFTFRPIVGMHAAAVVLFAAAYILSYNASHRMTDLYKQPTQALSIGIAVATLIALLTLLSRLIFSGTPPPAFVLTIFFLATLLGGLFLRAGYIFNKAARY